MGGRTRGQRWLMEIYQGKEDKEILRETELYLGEEKTGEGGQREKMSMMETRWIYWGKGWCRCKLGNKVFQSKNIA